MCVCVCLCVIQRKERSGDKAKETPMNRLLTNTEDEYMFIASPFTTLVVNPEINPCMYDQLIYNKRAKNMQWREDNLFNKLYWENWIATYNRMKLDHYLTPYTKFNSKQIKDFNIRPEIVKLPEENTGG